MPLHESGEMYLETLYILNQEKNDVRAIDLASHMGYSRPSVSRAVGILKNDGYLQVDKDNTLSLTEKGEEVAKRVYDRHITLRSILESIGVSKDTANDDACKMEHILSDETYEKLKKFHKK